MYSLGQKFVSELLGTMVLILFGCGVVAMVVLFDNGNGALVNGGYTNIVLGWGFAVTFACYVAFISGAHLNPAVTLAMALTKRFPWKEVVPYVVAQLIGAFLGALIVFCVYYYKWIEFDPNFVKTTGVFATFPAVKPVLGGIVDQIVGTFLLVFVILAITDKTSNNPNNLTPIVVGFLVMAIGISFGGMHGYAINPARDFAPRLFALLVGFKNTGFETHIWLVPVVAPIVGGVLGALVYDYTIGCFIKKNTK